MKCQLSNVAAWMMLCMHLKIVRTAHIAGRV